MLAYIAYSIGALLAVIVLIALVIKKDYVIVSEVVINKPKDEVFNYIIQLKNQRYYNKWIMADPDVKLNYAGVDATVGFISAWETNNAGKGEQEITAIKNGESCDVELRFEKPFKGVSYYKAVTESVSASQTKVRTTFNTRTEFPMSAMIPFLKIMLTKDMHENARNLKTVIEKQ
jgi:hypothetical protein